MVCGAGVLWGTIGPVVDVVHDRSQLSVLTIGAYRSIAAVAAVGLAVFLTGRMAQCRTLVRNHAGRLVVVGGLAATFQLLFFIAVVAAGVSIAAVVAMGIGPALLLVLESVRRRRLPRPFQTLTVVMAVGGLLLVSVVDGGPAATTPAVGVAAALGSGVAYALSTEIGAPLARRHDALVVGAMVTAVAALALCTAGFVVAGGRGEPVQISDGVSWVLVVYLGAVTMGLAYVLLFAGLRTTPSGTVVVATLLEPVTALLIAFVALGERLGVAGVIGCLLIIAAIGGLGRRAQPPEPH